MQGSPLIGWLYWNPSREIFTIPLIDRPITWYGLFFVLGFMIGYFLLIPFLTRFLYQAKHLSSLDIHWPTLLKALQRSSLESSEPDKHIFTKLSPDLRKQIKAFNPQEVVPESLKNNLLNELNLLLKDNVFTRKELEERYPIGIHPAKQTSIFLADRLCWFLITGTLLGARLGVVFFYDWSYYSRHPIEIFKIWHGGLASHGGAAGLGIALYLYVSYIRQWYPSLTFLKIMDAISIPAALEGCFIRLGNFVNQEILGIPTLMPWGVIFGDPWANQEDQSLQGPLHPVQLYEGLANLVTFFILYFLWRKKGDTLRPGIISGLLLILVFSSRFILEFWKSNQEGVIHFTHVQMGQLLSLPFILLGLLFIYCPKRLAKKSLSNY